MSERSASRLAIEGLSTANLSFLMEGEKRQKLSVCIQTADESKKFHHLDENKKDRPLQVEKKFGTNGTNWNVQKKTEMFIICV